MMARRTHRDEGVAGAAKHDFIDSRRGPTHAMRYRLEAFLAHHGVGIEVDSSACGCRGLDRIDVAGGVNAQDRRAIHFRGLRPVQQREALMVKGPNYRVDTVWTFRMTRSSIVKKAGGVAQEKCGHGKETRGTRGHDRAGIMGLAGPPAFGGCTMVRFVAVRSGHAVFFEYCRSKIATFEAGTIHRLNGRPITYGAASTLSMRRRRAGRTSTAPDRARQRGFTGNRLSLR